MAISFVAASSFNSTADASSVSYDRPAGVTAGDFMVMVVGMYEADAANVTSSGWTRVDTYQNDLGDAAAILTKTAGASEPSTYTVAYGETVTAGIGGISAYRGCTGLLVEGSANEQAASPPLATPSLSNTDASNWRVAAAYAAAGSALGTPSINETSKRFGGSSWTDVKPGSSYFGYVQLYDSNAPIAVGSTSRTATISSGSTWWAYAWLGILVGETATPASGPMACTLPSPAASAPGEVHNDGTAAATLPAAVFAGTGTGAPEAASGTMDTALPALSPSVSAAVEVSGSLSASVLPSVEFTSETRRFGIRVITVEADNRTIVVPSREVDD